jgi:hypothetical protein
MKIQPAHYAYMLAACRATLAASTPEAIAAFTAGKSAERIRWDLSYAAGLTPYICENVYPYANDAHVDTALRAIAAGLNLPQA